MGGREGHALQPGDAGRAWPGQGRDNPGPQSPGSAEGMHPSRQRARDRAYDRIAHRRKGTESGRLASNESALHRSLAPCDRGRGQPQTTASSIDLSMTHSRRKQTSGPVGRALRRITNPGERAEWEHGECAITRPAAAGSAPLAPLASRHGEGYDAPAGCATRSGPGLPSPCRARLTGVVPARPHGHTLGESGPGVARHQSQGIIPAQAPGATPHGPRRPRERRPPRRRRAAGEPTTMRTGSRDTDGPPPREFRGG